MKNILLCAMLLGLLGSCSLEKIVMKSAHRPQLTVEETQQFKKANKYQQDFLYLTDLIEESFSYHERYFEGDFEQEKKIVFERLTKVEEPYQFDYAAKEFLAKLNNNHTYLRAEETEIFPLAIRIFDGELVIVNVGSKVDSNLIGQTIASINDTLASQLLKYSLALTEGETPFQDTSNARRAFYILNFYKYYGVLKDGKVLHVKTKESDNQIFDIPLLEKEDKWQGWKKESNAIYKMTRYVGKGYGYKVLEDKNLAYFQFNTFMDKPTMLDGIGTYIRKPYQGLVRGYIRHQYKRMRKGKKVQNYFQKGTENLKDFLAKMFDEIQGKKIETLVIDLRRNGGGNLELGNYITSYLAGGEHLKGYGEGFELAALDYLVKPFSLPRFLQAVNRAIKKKATLLKIETPSFFFIKADGRNIKVFYEDILYIEAMSEYIRIHTRTQKITTLQSLRNMETKLPAEKFLRVHRSYLVALDKIEAIEGNQVLIGKIKVPVSKSHRPTLGKLIESHNI